MATFTVFNDTDVFNYQLLNRMQQDCEYFLGFGNRQEKYLWSRSVDKHISDMKELWNSLPNGQKPVWLTYEDILDYENKMRRN